MGIRVLLKRVFATLFFRSIGVFGLLNYGLLVGIHLLLWSIRFVLQKEFFFLLDKWNCRKSLNLANMSNFNGLG